MAQLSLHAYQQAQMRSGTDAWIGLVTIKDSNGTVLLRLAVGDAAVVSNGDTYSPRFIDVILDDQDGESPPEATLTMDGVDRAVLQAVDALEEAPKVDIAYVLSSDLDTEVIRLSDLRLRSFRNTPPRLSGRLEGPDFLNEPCPGRLMDPTNTPGLFD